MNLVDDHVWEAIATFRHGAFPSFQVQTKSNSTTNLFGDDPASALASNSTLKQNQSPIALGYPGTYRIIFNDQTLNYSMAWSQPAFDSQIQSLGFVGDPNANSSTPMILVADNTWEIDVLVNDKSANRFHFASPELGNLGDTKADGTAEANGADIALSDLGEWHITFNDKTLAYKAEKRTSALYGKVHLKVNTVAFQNGVLVKTPLAHARICLDATEGGQYCMNFGWSTDDNGASVVDLPAGNHRVAFGAALSSHWVIRSDFSPFTIANSQDLSEPIDVVPETTCINATASVPSGKALYVTGQSSYLGDWKTAYKLSHNGNAWYFQGQIPSGLEFKLILTADGASTISTQGASWESGANHKLLDPQQYTGGAPQCVSVAPSF
jgi:hypothetical protein